MCQISTIYNDVIDSTELLTDDEDEDDDFYLDEEEEEFDETEEELYVSLYLCLRKIKPLLHLSCMNGISEKGWRWKWWRRH